MFEPFLKLVALCAAGIIAVVCAVLGITGYLGPDDLASCHGSPQPADSRCVTADAIVAISGGDTDARAREAIRLYKAGWAPKLIFSGAALDKQGPSNAAAMRQQAIRAGVPKADILIDEDSSDTAGNASAISSIVGQNEIKRLILVTSAYHQRRANTEFSRALGKDVAVINHPTSEDRLWPVRSWWLTPAGWWLSLSELIKVLYVNLQGINL